LPAYPGSYPDVISIRIRGKSDEKPHEKKALLECMELL